MQNRILWGKLLGLQDAVVEDVSMADGGGQIVVSVRIAAKAARRCGRCLRRCRLRTFEDRYNATAQPFQWKFTTSDLDDLFARLDRHTPAGRQEESSDALAA